LRRSGLETVTSLIVTRSVDSRQYDVSGAELVGGRTGWVGCGAD